VKNEEKLAALGFEGDFRFYYLNFAHLGRATVCVLRMYKKFLEPGEISHYIFARGVAFCNPRDQFARKLGRAIALGRLTKAVETRATSEGIPMRTPAGILNRLRGWTHLSEWGAHPTNYEKELFEEKVK
jgi:hypothetical protein